jgi:hypothetical protein
MACFFYKSVSDSLHIDKVVRISPSGEERLFLSFFLSFFFFFGGGA